MKLDTSVGHYPEFKEEVDEHFKGILMSKLRVGYDDKPVRDLIVGLLVKYGAMMRGEDYKDDILLYCPHEFSVVNGMPRSVPTGNWQRGETLKVEWIKSIVDPIDKSNNREGTLHDVLL